MDVPEAKNLMSKNTARTTRGAAIDVGSNSVKLWVADRSEDNFPSTVHEEIKITGLGEGVSDAGRLGEAPMTRTIDAVKRFSEIARDRDAGPIVAAATSAVRRAENRQAFLDRVRDTCELDLEVLSGEREAKLTFLGVTFGRDEGDRRFLTFDVGGGSTELTAGPEGRPAFRTSVPVGSVSLYEDLGWEGVVSGGQLEEGISTVRERMREPVRSLREQMDGTDLAVIGVGGTVATLVQVSLGMTAFDREAIEGHEMKRVKLGAATATLAGQTPAERIRDSHVKEGRREYIIGGAALICGLMDVLSFPAFHSTCRGLRHGLLIDHLHDSTR